MWHASNKTAHWPTGIGEQVHLATKIIMFLSSYSPVFILLSFRTPQWWAKTLLLGLTAVSLVGLWLILTWTKRKPVTTSHVISRRDAGAEASGFLAAYLLPILVFDTTDWYFFWACFVFLSIALIVTVRSSLIQVNPVLFILGWRILAVEVAARQGDKVTVSRYLLTRKDVRVGAEIKGYRLGKDVLLRYTPVGAASSDASNSGTSRQG